MAPCTLAARRTFLARAAGLTMMGGAAFAQELETEEEQAFLRLFPEGTQRSVERGLQYLASKQNEDGSWGDRARNVGICGLCGMAMLAQGSVPMRGTYGANVNSAIDFLLSCSQESGFIADRATESPGPMYGHGFATLFLAEVYGMALQPDLRERLVQAVQLIVTTQNSAGGWRYEPRRADDDVSVTVCQMMALRAARNAGLYVANETVDRAMDYVKRCQNEDGGFRYMPDKPDRSEFPRSAAAVVALYSGGLYEGPEIEKALTYVARYRPGASASASAQAKYSHFIYGHYYAAQAMWLAGGARWTTWYSAIRDLLMPRQEADGGWFDPNGFNYGTAMNCLVLQMPKNYLPIFRR